ncbi:MAG: triose-phosphate isomerase, partial [Spirochaetales bacterium]|nr:triose-phosphate isomerase [Spirochaetales bacterium]
VTGLAGTPTLVGVQNIHWAESGPYTGEISAIQARDAGASLVEVGHSERRVLFGDTDEIVARKARSVVTAGLTALVCVGESDEMYRLGRSVEYVTGQVATAISLLPPGETPRLWIAYEPVWAIGEGGRAADPDHVRRVHEGIRTELSYRLGDTVAAAVPILYGGSVSLQNAASFLAVPEVDGLFVGRTALDPGRFVELIRLAANLQKKNSTVGKEGYQGYVRTMDKKKAIGETPPTAGNVGSV